MTRRGKAKSVVASREPPAAEAAQPAVRAATTDGQKETRRRRRRGDGSLEERIDYRFKDPALLDSALSHISSLKGSRNRAGSYQRLEFLGDHVLGLVISDMLFRAFPIDLGAAIRLGSSEANAGGRKRPAILADVCEALIGAVYLDGGFPAAEALVGRLWEERLRTTAQPLRDPKTVLQEWAQARGLPTPAYKEVARSGPHHDPEFRVAVHLAKFAPAEGLGRSKRAAEQAAAAAMMAREGVKPERANG